MSDAPPVDVTIREITELVRLFEQTGWASLELDIHGMHLTLGKEGAPRQAVAPPVPPSTTESSAPESRAPASAAPAPAAREPAEREPEVANAPQSSQSEATATTAPSTPGARSASSIEVRSPVVGAFWVAPSPGEPPFVRVGDRVEVGQQIAIVEVMKLMSDVSAPAAGVVVEICADNADMVEYDQVLFVIDPDA